jgi:Mitochondrial carrier protein
MTLWDMWGVTSGQLNFLQDELMHDMLRGLVCGAVAGIVAKTVVAPAERIKMTFQVSAEPFTLHRAYLRSIEVVKSGGRSPHLLLFSSYFTQYYYIYLPRYCISLERSFNNHCSDRSICWFLVRYTRCS